MKPKTIKQLDKWIGGLICLFLTFFRKGSELFSSKNVNDSITNKILFIKLIEQGATVIAYSAIKKAIDFVGKGNVYFCVFVENKPILELLDVIPEENILTLRQNNIFIFIKDLIKTLHKTRNLKIDTTIDMEFFSRSSAIISYMTGAGKRIGYHRFTSEYPYRGNLMTHKMEYNPYIHTGKAYQLLVEAINMDATSIPLPKINLNNLELVFPEFTATDEEKEKILKLITEERRNKIDYPIILLNPNAGDMLPIRKWETANFMILAKMIVEHFKNVTVILTGSPSERCSAEEICKKINLPEVISLAGKTTLRELFVLYTVSDILVTNDSGPGHFSSITNIHSIVLFGPETPLLFGPISKNTHSVHMPLACSPCVNAFNHRFSPCKDNLCMRLIKPEDVFDIIEKITNQ